MLIIYQIIFYLLLPFIFLRLWWRGRKIPAYRQRWKERLGFFTAPTKTPTIWLHAVSFGEAKLATTLVNALQAQYPAQQFVVTTTTVTGSQQIQNTLAEKVLHVYLPYDIPGAVKRFLKRVQPQIAIILETELWPTLLHECAQQNIPVIIANARLSARSAQQYGYLKSFTRMMLTSVTKILAQTQEDAARFSRLGADAKKITVTGNIKFDITPPADCQQQGKLLRQKLGVDRPVWIAASTHAGEEKIILQVLQKVREKLPNCALILVPRHPERFEEVAQLCQNQFQLARHSAAPQNLSAIDIYLGDSMGELWNLYAASDVALVGGSLIPHGGHNMIKPAALSLPILSGKYYFHFQAMAELLLQANALTIVSDVDDFAKSLLQLLSDPTLRQQQGHRAFEVVQQNQGALQKQITIIGKYLIS